MSRDDAHPKMEPGLRTVMIYRARNPADAHIIRMALEEAGIPVLIEGEALQGVVPEVPVWNAAPRILVAESQVTAAQEIIHQVQSRERGRPEDQESDQGSDRGSDGGTACLACGHAMDDTAVKCPSCGWTFQSDEDA